ncbi:hypothetical protein P7L75_02510 (plasmid) [Tistrella mobilis]|uniref:hypothetical protein n=1 Tax=Tistrella mobilis TaxID=171437 RepID=UPI003557C85B
MKKLAALIFGLFLLIALVDGVLDIGLGLAYGLRNRMAEAARNADPYTDIREEALARLDALPQRYMPGTGSIYQPGAVPGLTIGEDGERLHTHVAAPDEATRHILLIGASQAFGSLNRDDASLAAALERAMPGTVVRNFASPGQRLPGNTMVLERRIAAGDRIDQVLVVNGTLDLVMYCLPPTTSLPRPRPVLAELAARLMDGAPIQPATASHDGCTTPEGQAAALDRLMADIDEVLAAAARRNLPITLAFVPAPYVADAGDGSFDNLAQFQGYRRAIDPLIPDLRARIAGISGIVDLTQGFGTGRPGMFIDLYGHFTDAGNEALAPLLAGALNRQRPPAGTVR